MRAAVYVRQSSDRQGLGLAVERQQEDCLKLCKERGWTVTAELVDNDVSASNGKRRPGFDQLLALIDARQIDVVVVWAVDRLVRRLADLEDVIERVEKAGVRLVTVSGDIDLSTDQGRLVGRILASVARGEVERKSTRQRRAQAQAAAQGRRVGGRRPFGYDADGVTIRADEAAAIKKSYRDLLTGVPLARIAKDWNEAGFTTGQRKRDGSPSPWRHDSARVVLANPRNAGLRAYKGEIVGPAVWKAIVDEDTWRAALTILDNPERRTGTPGAQGLLTGIARCGVCGDTVHLGRSRVGQRLYRCRGSYGHVSRKAEPVEDYVSNTVVARLSRADARRLVLATPTPDTAEHQTEAATVRARLDSLAVDFADGSLTRSQLRTATERLRARLAELEAQIADAGRVNVLGPLLDADDVYRAWDDLDDDRRRSVIDALATVTLKPPGRGVRNFDAATVDIEWTS